MRVRAKRLGWNERLTAEQEYDLEPYEAASDDLEGELVRFSVPAQAEHPAFEMVLVGGQEADPATVVAIP